jgi:hypothetical protein
VECEFTVLGLELDQCIVLRNEPSLCSALRVFAAVVVVAPVDWIGALEQVAETTKNTVCFDDHSGNKTPPWSITGAGASEAEGG